MEQITVVTLLGFLKFQYLFIPGLCQCHVENNSCGMCSLTPECSDTKIELMLLSLVLMELVMKCQLGNSVNIITNKLWSNTLIQLIHVKCLKLTKKWKLIHN
jgi:hypothetical protein